MKSFKTAVLRFRSATLKYTLLIMGLSGFSMLISCAKYGAPMAEYGTPYNENKMNFHGNVLSEDSLKPIPNIKIKIYADWLDTVYTTTNAQGNYSVLKDVYQNQLVKMVLQDADSTQNGSFLSKTVELDITFRDVNNLEHLADITLQRKP
ncbi:MAG: radical SAM-associated putative lipoprotein [Bacteroidota bacterium]